MCIAGPNPSSRGAAAGTKREPPGGDRPAKIGISAELCALTGLYPHASHCNGDGQSRRALCCGARQLLGARGKHRRHERQATTGEWNPAAHMCTSTYKLKTAAICCCLGTGMRFVIELLVMKLAISLCSIGPCYQLMHVIDVWKLLPRM